MKVEMIDLEEFYNPKYSYYNNQGIGAECIITPYQMVTRMNRTQRERNTGEMCAGLGYHEEQRIAIVRDIFNLPDVLDTGLEYYEPDLVELTQDYKNIFKEVIEIVFTNCPNNYRIGIRFPENNKGLTTNQLNCLQYLSNKIEEASSNMGIDIIVSFLDDPIELEETNSISNIIIPYLEKYLDDSHKLSYQDVNIIPQEELEPVVSKTM